jgi:hypothetical protein
MPEKDRSREDADPDIRPTIPKSKNIIACTQSRARAQNARKNLFLHSAEPKPGSHATPIPSLTSS